MTADKWAGLSLEELLAEREALDAKIQAVRSEAREIAIAQIHELMTTYGLTREDVMPGSAEASRTRKAGPRKKAPAKYYDPNSGKTWTGRGKAPRWIAGQDYANFLIPAEGILRKLAQQEPVSA
ncbi:histone family protein nucleoid-structuring protein H-NS [Alicycliphilus sp. B1]|nr:histone family protein nucleoid-structuring protein H-NS [Alicycliphilus sp. B1]